MKSRISFFDKAVLRKDITRFAPLWAIYLVGGLLVMLVSMSGIPSSYAARYLSTLIAPFSIINLIYGILCAQLLFGDLFQTRLCNALHALPLRRETWFCSHVISGLLFSLVPHLIAVILMMPMLQSYWFVGLIWLLGMTLEFLCFFGIGVFSVFCTGNRFAMAAIYAIINFASLIVYWFVTTIYEPLLYGISVPIVPFRLFCPVVRMNMTEDLVLFERVAGEEIYWQYQGFGDGWWYLAICAAVGVALLAASLLLYRRRKLECAGDFVAVKSAEPVFGVILTVCIGGVFAMMEQVILSSFLVFLCAGLVIGWFVSRMLLQRTVKVFQGKAFVKLVILLLVLGTTIFLTWLDPMGITRWVPEESDVKLVEIDLSAQISKNSGDYLEFSKEEDIRKVMEAHQNMVEDRSVREGGYAKTITVRYTLTNGLQVSRTYRMRDHTKAWRIAEALYNTPEQVFGYTDWETFVDETEISFCGRDLLDACKDYDAYVATDKNVSYVKQYDTLKRSLLEAMRKDCEEGTLTYLLSGNKPYTNIWIGLQTGDEWNGGKYRSFDVNEDCSHILQWAETYKVLVKYIEPYAII